MTEDGAIFENDDPISVTFGEVISSTVLDWKLPHISKRYMEVCQQLKTGEKNRLVLLFHLEEGNRAGKCLI